MRDILEEADDLKTRLKEEGRWPPPHIKFRVDLWDAINRYAAACGGDPSVNTVSAARMKAVAEVERVIRNLDPSAI